MSSDLLHVSSKITPLGDDAEVDLSQSSVNAALASEDDVLTYGELQSQVLPPSNDGSSAGESFEGTSVDLAKSPFEINNELFEGKLHVLMRDLPGNTYDFDGDKDVLWEIQIQGKFKRQIKGPIYLALELPQHEKYRVTPPMKMVIRAMLQLMKTMGHKDVHLSFGGNDELPHMGAPAFHSFDRVVVTPSGGTPPVLGEHLPKTQSDIQRRKSFFKLDQKIDLNSTYTFSVKNRRFDPLNWKVIGVPIIRQFTVSRYTESVRLSVYEVLEENGKPVQDPKGRITAMAKKKHTKRNYFLWIKMSRKKRESK
mmetsp:Transcript_27129/g.31022  ORF Transcript_27129/g.31022 Transcript_27129/m.31022 type:complete len:310 (+) Transcript_27129:91-1020(+)